MAHKIWNLEYIAPIRSFSTYLKTYTNHSPADYFYGEILQPGEFLVDSFVKSSFQ